MKQSKDDIQKDDDETHHTPWKLSKTIHCHSIEKIASDVNLLHLPRVEDTSEIISSTTAETNDWPLSSRWE